jgi:hypothetical protein
MAETKKITKREVITELLKEDLIQETPMYKDYLVHELELLDKKNASSRGAKDSEETQEIATMLLEEMAKFEETGKEKYTISELMQFSETIQNYTYGDNKVLSNSKITSVLRNVLKEQVANVKDKKNSYYYLAK